MPTSSLVRRLGTALALICAGSAAASAQENLGEGFAARAAAEAPIEDTARQPELFVLQVDLKPMRMVNVEITDPQTGEKSTELVTYIVYRAVNRPLARRDSNEATPVNVNDPPVSLPMFVPSFELVTEDTPERLVYRDQVVPEALARINRRERRDYKDAVNVVRPIEPPSTGEPTDEQTIYGVAMWRNVDPSADHFSVYMTGFSNGYKVEALEDGTKRTLRKVLKQTYWRPGDELEQREREIRMDGTPTWVYR